MNLLYLFSTELQFDRHRLLLLSSVGSSTCRWTLARNAISPGTAIIESPEFISACFAVVFDIYDLEGKLFKLYLVCSYSRKMHISSIETYNLGKYVLKISGQQETQNSSK